MKQGDRAVLVRAIVEELQRDAASAQWEVQIIHPLDDDPGPGWEPIGTYGERSQNQIVWRRRQRPTGGPSVAPESAEEAAMWLEEGALAYGAGKLLREAPSAVNVAKVRQERWRQGWRLAAELDLNRLVVGMPCADCDAEDGEFHAPSCPTLSGFVSQKGGE